jgi:hypothetical protein
MLGFEAQSVVALRLTRLAVGGPSSQAEAMRMISDKLSALAEVQIIAVTAAVTGQSANVVAGKILRKYKNRVGANRRRLSGPR